MSEQEVVTAYLEGRIGQWALYRRLVKTGVSVGTALTLALGLPAVARGEETLEELSSRAKQTRSDDSTELDRLLTIVGNALGTAVETGNLNPLAVSVAKLGVNVDVPVDESVRLDFRGTAGSVPVNLVGMLLNLGEKGDFRNMQLLLGGTLGSVPINFAGNVDAPLASDPGVNVSLGKATLNFAGSTGDVPLNFSGNIGNVVVTPTEIPD